MTNDKLNFKEIFRRELEKKGKIYDVQKCLKQNNDKEKKYIVIENEKIDKLKFKCSPMVHLCSIGYQKNCNYRNSAINRC